MYRVLSGGVGKPAMGGHVGALKRPCLWPVDAGTTYEVTSHKGQAQCIRPKVPLGAVVCGGLEFRPK